MVSNSSSENLNKYSHSGELFDLSFRLDRTSPSLYILEPLVIDLFNTMTAFENKEPSNEGVGAEVSINDPKSPTPASSNCIKRLIGLDEPVPPLPTKAISKRDSPTPKSSNRSLPSGSKLSKASDHVMAKGSRLLQPTTASMAKSKTSPIYKDRISSSHRRLSTGAVESEMDSELTSSIRGKYQKREVTPPKERHVHTHSLDRFEDANTTNRLRRKSLDGALGSIKSKSNLSDSDSKIPTHASSFADKSEDRKTSRSVHSTLSSSSKARPKSLTSSMASSSSSTKPMYESKPFKSRIPSPRISPSKTRHSSSSSPPSQTMDKDSSEKFTKRGSGKEETAGEFNGGSESDTDNDYSSIESSPLHMKTMTDLASCRDLCESEDRESPPLHSPSVRKLVHLKNQKTDARLDNSNRKLSVEKGNKVPLLEEDDIAKCIESVDLSPSSSITLSTNEKNSKVEITAKTKNQNSGNLMPNVNRGVSNSHSNRTQNKPSGKEETVWGNGNDTVFSPVSTLDLNLVEETMDSPHQLKKAAAAINGLSSSSTSPAEKVKTEAKNELTIKIHPNAFNLEMFKAGEEENDLNGIIQSLSDSPSKYSTAESYESLEFASLDFIGEIEGMEKDLEYVRHILIISGFASDHLCPAWFSPSFPLNPALFEQLEHELKVGVGDTMAGDNGIESRRRAERHQRMLLFDAVNEALRLRLLPYLERPPWVKPSKPIVRTRPVGKELLQEVWGEIHSWPVSASDEVYDILDDAARRDMARGVDKWEELGLEEAEVWFQVEECLFDELLEEVVCGFTEIEMQRNKKRYMESGGGGLGNLNRRSSVVDVTGLGWLGTKEEVGLKWITKLTAVV